MGVTFVRVHAAGESLETLLNPRRPDGWVASDETYEAQPLGVSCCDSLDDLRRYIRAYSMAVQPGDRLVLLTGRRSYEADRDHHASRAIVESYEVLGDAREWLDLCSRIEEWEPAYDELEDA